MNKVDVLEVLAGWCNEHGIGKVEYDRRSGIYDAVAELIKADLNFDAAELELSNAKYGPYTKRLSRHEAAEKHRSLALANIGSTK